MPQMPETATTDPRWVKQTYGDMRLMTGGKTLAIVWNRVVDGAYPYRVGEHKSARRTFAEAQAAAEDKALATLAAAEG
jgi:hypothetical protein